MARLLQNIKMGEKLEVLYEGRWYKCHVTEQPRRGRQIQVYVFWRNRNHMRKQYTTTIRASRADLRRRKK